MALNTAEKRRAVAGLTPLSSPGVTPNSNTDLEWRTQVAKSYFFGPGADPEIPEAPAEVVRHFFLVIRDR